MFPDVAEVDDGGREGPLAQRTGQHTVVVRRHNEAVDGVTLHFCPLDGRPVHLHDVIPDNLETRRGKNAHGAFEFVASKLRHDEVIHLDVLYLAFTHGELRLKFNLR